MSEKLNIHNYESFFLDYKEGNLNSKQIFELKNFLEKHPELKEELESFESFTLEAENICYENKNDLIKDSQSKYFDISEIEFLCIAETEKDLTIEEQKQLTGKINKNEKIIDEINLFKKAKLKADQSIVFERKKELIKNRIPINAKIISLAAAAIFTGVLVLNVSGLFNNKTDRNGDHLYSGIRMNNNGPSVSENNSEEKSVQEALISHNQTNKQTNNDDLVFADNEPQTNGNLYKELTVSIPDIKQEALIFSEERGDIISTYAFISENNKNEKENLWQYAEKGVTVWKLLSSSELEMNNQYYADGTIEKLNISSPNFKLRRTFYKNR